mgnify:CR=1 FL=1
MLKSGGRVHGKVGMVIGLTYAELNSLRGDRGMMVDLSDLGPEWAGRNLLLMAAPNDATLAATLRQSSPTVPIVDQRRHP